ncbi:glycine-rich domain-containing protein 1 [Cucumis melo var. makuwa]|uniref:Glycine-rich domain-containing protein 1 n=1 Tax=Cucumis melo var. makuwa TaxID=1194695 RepID=A0A5A7U4Z0_CUCMM|nr:glycine-rich domain-containing protein 1 [Cucumis melo var. makuwa]
MSSDRPGSELSASISARSLGDISEFCATRIGLDIISAVRRNLGFLRTVADSHWLHSEPTITEAIRRYEELWMPLISDLTVAGSSPPMILPPLDVEWVWFCHTLNPVGYKHYCETRFFKLIGKPSIFDEENEEYAYMRCKEIWVKKYPTQSFELEENSSLRDVITIENQELLEEIKRQRNLYSNFSEPFRSEIVYLIAAKQRYKGFLYMLQRFSDECSSFVPASDILLMWLTHQSYPTVYAEDVKEMQGDLAKVVRFGETVNSKELDETKQLWHRTFGQPYEKAGGGIIMELGRAVTSNPLVYLETSHLDVNTKYKSMTSRFVLEVCVFMWHKAQKQPFQHVSQEFLRLRSLRCHREFKLDQPISSLNNDLWHKAWHLYCEFGTKGVVLELRHPSGNCFKGSSIKETTTFKWNDLIRAPSLTLERQLNHNLKIVVSITPPVQAPYLLKCVPDKVTDDSGAMVSDVVLRMNQYRPQEGRWLSRTVLDHGGRECFVIRMRVGGGFWRRGGETPLPVKWEDRIIEIREGSWSYIAGSIGRTPEKVVGTATPKQPLEELKAAWNFSTGDELIIQWDTSTTKPSLSFSLTNPASESSVRLLKGREFYHVWRKVKEPQHDINVQEEEKEGGDDDGFVTMIRYTDEDPTGRATALLNWKLLVIELLPEEDAVLALLICISILRSISEMKKEDVGNLLIRRRLRETKIGLRDWGSIILHPSKSSTTSSPYLRPWYWNAETVMASNCVEHLMRQPASLVEGGDKLYKQGIIS